ncbi:hypothetical protein KP79_PYT00810 [Mizuhopecten yessoensis]|uniref:Uncharacterized protein n=1 Tax=Mizuhopecten yessoensis TaxID=6573 RepID=A0A210QQ37_MIZYE|nr:hypothetical protein KP79_PYT00810 [Mizuhopecten yessoensis]
MYVTKDSLRSPCKCRRLPLCPHYNHVRPWCAPTYLLWRCRKPYCTATTTLLRFYCAHVRTQSSCCAYFVHALSARRLMGVLSNRIASNGDATVLLRRCWIPYCA